MKLQKSTQFGIFAVLELARYPGLHLSATDIAGSYGISTHHLAKVMRDLGKAGMVESIRGVGGGYVLSCNIKRVTLRDIIEIFENIGENSSIKKGGSETDAEIALHTVLGEIDDITKATFGSITIETLLKIVKRQTQNTTP